MKALSIIGIVISFSSCILAVAISDISCYCYNIEDNYYDVDKLGVIPGLISLIFSLFFLAFSIVATVKSFKKK